MKLRSATEADYETLVSWIPDAKSCLYWGGPRLIFPFDGVSLCQQLQRPREQRHVLTNNDGRMLGFAQHWQLVEGEVHLGRIILSPDRRGQGLGKRLLELLLPAALTHSGAQVATLRAYPDNQAALRLYQRFGFEIDEQANCEDVLCMRLSAKKLRHND